MYIYLCDRERIKNGEEAIRRFAIEYAADTGANRLRTALKAAPIRRSATGAPFFAHIPEIYFSVSHSGNTWGCVFTDSPVGFDLEELHRAGLNERISSEAEDSRWLKIAGRFFTAEECEYVRKGGRDAFFQLWVRKEAYVKYKGTELLHELDRIQLVADGEIVSRLPDAYTEQLALAEGLAGAYCAAEKKTVKAIIDYRNR